MVMPPLFNSELKSSFVWCTLHDKCFTMENDHTSAFYDPSTEDYSLRMGFVDDYVCAICDEGGNLIYCDGECGRLFHPTRSTGVDSKCQTLELSEEQVVLPKFLCKNCEYKQHQCFGCGKLGSSDMSSGLTEVFQCNKEGCNRFYHPDCLPEYDLNKRPQEFECPMHECLSCKKKGRKVTWGHATAEDMHLVLCRRCPVAYHWRCLPRDVSSVAEGKVSRIWEIEDRILFYCSKHEMVQDLSSAMRNHLKFPEVVKEHGKMHASKTEVENSTSVLHARRPLKGASKKQSDLPEGQFDHGNKESDLVPKNRDNGPKTHKGKPAPQQAETHQHTSVEHNAYMESFAPKSLFPGPQPGTCGWLDD